MSNAQHGRGKEDSANLFLVLVRIVLVRWASMFLVPSPSTARLVWGWEHQMSHICIIKDCSNLAEFGDVVCREHAWRLGDKSPSQLTRIEQGLDNAQLWLKRIMEGIGPGLLPDNFKELSHRLECLSAQIKGGQDGIAVEIASLRGMIERRCTGTTVHINRQLLRQLVRCAKPFKKAKPKKGRR